MAVGGQRDCGLGGHGIVSRLGRNLDVICAVLGCQIGDLLIPETEHVTKLDDQAWPATATGTSGPTVVPRRRDGRTLPPL